MKKLIKCGKLFNSKDGTVLEKMAVLVDGTRIESVTPLSAWDGKPTDGLEVIDLSSMFVSPGLIDAHMHLSSNGETDGTLDEVMRTVGSCALKALTHVQADLMAGFTSVRALGDMGYIDVALRREIDAGTVWGPRIMAAGPCIGSTGGHADSHFSPYVDIAISGGIIVDGPDEARKAARTVLKHGADLIKFMSTGGVMSRGTTVGAQQLTFEEIRAIVEVAEMYGVITATHAHGTNGIKTATRAGVTSVEHGMMLDEEAVDLMLEHGTYLVPTIIAANNIIVNGVAAGIPAFMVDKAKQVLERHEWGFRRCMELGVKICFGTDAATPFNYHGKQTYEFELMEKFGMSPTKSLIAATRTNAQMMRKWADVGSVEAGKFADIIAFAADPTKDSKEFMNCAFVMKGGIVYKS